MLFFFFFFACYDLTNEEKTSLDITVFYSSNSIFSSGGRLLLIVAALQWSEISVLSKNFGNILWRNLRAQKLHVDPLSFCCTKLLNQFRSSSLQWFSVFALISCEWQLSFFCAPSAPSGLKLMIAGSAIGGGEVAETPACLARACCSPVPRIWKYTPRQDDHP